MTRSRVSLLALLALTACGRGDAPAPVANQMSNDLLNPATEMARRWGTVFSDEPKRVAAAADLGYKIGPLRRDGDGFAATSAEQVIVLPHSPIKTRSTLRVSGAKADLADRYVFSFDATGDDGRETKAASDVSKTPLRVLMGFLQRFETQPDDEIKSSIKSFTPITKALPGATIAYASAPPADPKHPRNRRSSITITRPGVADPATVTKNQAARK